MATKKTPRPSLADRLAIYTDIVGRELGPEYADALGHYAAAHGKKWHIDLMDDWYMGRDAYFRNPQTGEPLGHLLRQIRNHPKHGKAFYEAAN